MSREAPGGERRSTPHAITAIEPMERRALRWLITFPGDGMLVDRGMMPSLIRWPEGAHPAGAMRDLGASLERLEAAHPDPAAYRRDLASIGADRLVEVRGITAGSRPHLVAHIRTPQGIRVLR